MIIGVISDTHIPASCNELPSDLIKHLKGVDLIIHAGDLTELYVIDELKKIALTEAVVGNMDSYQVRNALPETKILTQGDFKIGIIHGRGHPDNLITFIQEKFKEVKLDCIVYGHSHKARVDTIDNTIYINPGSPTDEVFTPFKSFGILELGQKIMPRIIRL